MILNLIDFILNVAGLLLWLNWRSSGLDPINLATPATLAGTLRRASRTPVKRWQFPALLGGLVGGRALFYWLMGAAANWTPGLDVGAIYISFGKISSGFAGLGQMLFFSALSFGATLVAFYLWLIGLSLLKPAKAELDPMHRLVRQHSGLVDRWPRWMSVLLPLVGGTVTWWLLSWPLVHWRVLTAPVSALHRAEQALVVGLGFYLAWKYLVFAVLGLHLLASYVYFGNHPFWNYVHGVARVLLAPLRLIPLRIGRLDLAPVVALALVYALGRVIEIQLPALYQRLPL